MTRFSPPTSGEFALLKDMLAYGLCVEDDWQEWPVAKPLACVYKKIFGFTAECLRWKPSLVCDLDSNSNKELLKLYFSTTSSNLTSV